MLLRNILISALHWGTLSFNYYLLAFYMKYIHGSIYINNVMSALAEFFACIVSGFLINKFGLKKSLSAYFGLTGFVGIGLMLDQHNLILVPICVFACKFGVSAAFNGSYLCNMALYPSSLLSAAFSVCNGVARGVTIIAPIIAELEGAGPLLLMCALSLLSMTLVPCMITSEDTKMNDIQDIKPVLQTDEEKIETD